ncbi:hypothethical protein (plasmid) [Ralstonia solanacearum CMR15]|nr:hypothethical protein [Ralstonia solanacearum CMR15]
MSYDLFFTFPQPAQRSAVEEYFGPRPHYQLNGSAVYESRDTGVYFLFEFQASEDDPNQLVGASLNVNYFRPHIFGLEAEPEVRAFVEHFQLGVEDPQMHGMGQGPYTAEGFLSGWNAGNAFAYEAITAQNKGPFLSCPEAKLEAAWRWNQTKSAVQQKLEERMFVPTIMFANIGGELQSVVVWGDGIPTLMPPTDAIIVVRDELAPKPLFRPRTKDTCVIASSDLADLFGPFAEQGYAMPVRVPTYDKPTRDVTKFFGSLRAFTGQLQIVSVDNVLSQELLSKCR